MKGHWPKSRILGLIQARIISRTSTLSVWSGDSGNTLRKEFDIPTRSAIVTLKKKKTFIRLYFLTGHNLPSHQRLPLERGIRSTDEREVTSSRAAQGTAARCRGRGGESVPALRPRYKLPAQAPADPMTQPQASHGTQRVSHEGTGTEEKEVSKAERPNPLILPYQPHASAHPRTAAQAAPQSCRRHVGRARVTFPCRVSIASAAATVSRSTSLGKSVLNGVGVGVCWGVGKE